MDSAEIRQRSGMIDITSFGIFNTDKAFPAMKQSSGRVTGGFEIEFFLDCTGKAIVDGREYKLYPSALLLCKPGQRRQSIFAFRCYYLHFCLSEASPYYALLSASPDYYRIIDIKMYSDIFSDLLRHLTENEDNRFSDYTSAKMIELFYLLARDAERNAAYLALGCGEGRADDFVPRCISYINDHLGEKISLKTLSETFHYSPNYIQSVFHRVAGVTPQCYLEDIRLQQAKIMLAERKESLSKIALLCGFSSQSHFTACFRKHFGCTPRKWQYNADQPLRSLYEKTPLGD